MANQINYMLHICAGFFITQIAPTKFYVIIYENRIKSVIANKIKFFKPVLT